MNGAAAAKVRADAAMATKLGVTGTPAFFVGQIQADGRVKVSERVVGARPTAAFEAALDRALAQTRP
jgi:predicted DsbA family dithiol-disulfide isomerase